MYHNISPSSGLDLIDVSDDIDVSFMLGGEYSRIVVYIVEPQQAFVAEGPSSRNSQRNALPEQDQNIEVAPNLELVPERDREDIEPLKSRYRGVGNEVQLNVWQFFKNINECRYHLVYFAIHNNFVLTFNKSELGRVWASCKAEGCTWQVWCLRVGSIAYFKVKSMVKKHTCSDPMRRVHQPLARSDWMAKKIKGRLLDQPKIKANDIVKDVQRVHEVRLSYIQAWREKEVVREMIDGSHEQQYHDVPLYSEKIRRTNPRIEVRIYTYESSFQRLFIVYRPYVLLIDAGH
ncbi:hypothetical protein AMTR_s00121p00083230 [Amborella trichopoda]|uniref:Transposase MuDR plant domain-containing protein n=1 Tax=Amborella trichopoda TaxID=13333 RepID=W1NPI2_AMBTC|nr:hypothetical protein AMTR_s00121p00083230 [Amborella trichopoda]